jgi:hypothetical protein
MSKRILLVSTALTALALLSVTAHGQDATKKHSAPTGYTDGPMLPGQKWRVHDIARPRPRMVTAEPGKPPSDAIVLFDGKDLSHWVGSKKGGAIGPPGWKVEKGAMLCVPGAGDLVSKEKFGNAQYHIEWAAPAEIHGDSQARGNSGVLIMRRYEIQVLDSYNNLTYADGQAGAIYGQWPPLVNASRKPGEFQTYDIIWEAPVFQGGTLANPAYVTVLHNGVLLHHHQQVIGQMAHRAIKPYEPHEAEEPLAFQDHDTRVRIRQVWVRRLKGYDEQ